MKRFLSILSILVTSTLLNGVESHSFNFVYDDSGAIESISGYRQQNDDDTDSVQLYFSTPVTYRLLVDGGSVLSVPTTIERNDHLYLEITVGSDTYIVGAIEPNPSKSLIALIQTQVAVIIAAFLCLIFALCWHAVR